MAKKKSKKAGLHREVNHSWGYVVLALGALMIFAVAGYYYLTFLV
jgi:hypothetical protein